MKKTILTMALLFSTMVFANVETLTIPKSLNVGHSMNTEMDLNKIQSLINEAGELASVECKKRDIRTLDFIADEIGNLIRYHAGHPQFSTALIAKQRINDKVVKAVLCQGL